MKKVLLLILIIVIILVGVIVYQSLTKKEPAPKADLEEILMPDVLQGKKIAMVVAFRDFRDEEYFIPKQTLEAVGKSGWKTWGRDRS